MTQDDTGGAAADPSAEATRGDDGDGPALSDAARRRAERQEAAAAHADALSRRQAAESARARDMLAELVRRASADGPAPVPLRARSFDGRHRYRTQLVGWYLRQDESLAVSTSGDFYVLRAPATLAARWRGVELAPTDPPLVLGAGGKDGESLDLHVAIARVLGRS